MRLAVLIPVLSLAAAAGTVISGPAAQAADVPEYPIIEVPEPAPLPSSGGWYLRGDIGYKFYNSPDARVSNPDYGPFADYPNFWDEDLGDSFNVGVGAGYKFNDYFRMDLTLDYESPGEFSGRAYCDPVGCGTGGYTVEKADITAWSGLLNAYADLGTYGAFTPYIGAGIGASYLETSKVRQDGGDEYSGDGNWNFAWALMAGTSFAVNDQLSIDVGYRYINLGDARSGEIGDGPTTRILYDDIDGHEIRAGLRYNLY